MIKNNFKIMTGDSLTLLKSLKTESVQTCITSPPYWGLRDYGKKEQLGLEKNSEDYINNLVKIFSEVKRVLKNDGTLWLNLGDCFHNKQLIGIPWRVALKLQKDGWFLRSDIIWHKNNPMPESVKDRPTKAHEYIFLLSKSRKYFYDIDAIREPHTSLNETLSRKNKHNKGNKFLARPDLNSKRSRLEYYHEKGRNKRSVWTITTKPFPGAHFAVFPPDLIEPCVLAGSKEKDIILDPFSGAGTTGVVALKHNRKYLGLELNQDYVDLSIKRIKDEIKKS